MKSINKICLSKLKRQGGRCFYCQLPMWVAQKDSEVSAKIAPWQLQCTAEHLIARCDGGSNDPDNIVAACRFCNMTRHRSKRPKSPKSYLAFVRRRMVAGRWLAHFVGTALGDPKFQRPVFG